MNEQTRAYWREIHSGWDVAPAEVSLRAAWQALDRIEGNLLDGVPEAGPGECDDCRADAAATMHVPPPPSLARWRFGRLAVCRSCAVMRARADRRLGVAA